MVKFKVKFPRKMKKAIRKKVARRMELWDKCHKIIEAKW